MMKMKTLMFALVLVTLSGLIYVLPQPALAAKPILWSFDSSQNTVEASRHDFFTKLFGQGSNGKWMVVEDPVAPSVPNVYMQVTSDPTPGRYPLAISRYGKFTDFALTVKIKAVSGKIDQAGGLVFRYQDPLNFYTLQASAKDNKLQLYKVVKGTWTLLSNADVPVSANSWHALKVKTHGWLINGYLDGAQIITSNDNTFEHGRIGLITKADSIVQFDDLLMQSHDNPLDYPERYRSLYYRHK